MLKMLPVSLTVPGSKSSSNRALIAASIADSPSVIRNVSLSDDTVCLINALGKIGVSVVRQGNVLKINPVDRRPLSSVPVFDAEFGNAGTSLRFFTVMAAFLGISCRARFSGRMAKRPNDGLISAVNSIGGNIKKDKDQHGDYFEIIPSDSDNTAISLDSSESSQFLSAILLSAPALGKSLEIRANGLMDDGYVDMTIDIMGRFGVNVKKKSSFYSVSVGASYTGAEYYASPDITGASNFIMYSILKNLRLELPGFEKRHFNSEPGLLEALERTGAEVSFESGAMKISPPVTLKGIEIDADRMIDSVIAFAAASPLLESPSRFYNIGRLRKKESDRVASVCANYDSMGVEYTLSGDTLEVFPSNPRDEAVRTFDDHRIAMAFSVLRKARGFTVNVDNYGCVAKSMPDFFRLLDGMQ